MRLGRRDRYPGSRRSPVFITHQSGVVEQWGWYSPGTPGFGPQPPVVIAEQPLPRPIQTKLVAVPHRQRFRRPPPSDHAWQPVAHERTVGANSSSVAIDPIDDSTDRAAQSFTAWGTTLTQVAFSLSKSGSPADDLIFELQTDSGSNTPSGTVLASVTYPGSLWPNQTFTISGLNYDGLTVGQTYWVVIRRSGASDPTNRFSARRSNLSTAIDPYSGGVYKFSLDSGGSWGNAFRDANFILGCSVGSASLRLPTFGPRPPQTILEPPFARPVATKLVAVASRVARIRRTHSRLYEPVVVVPAEEEAAEQLQPIRVALAVDNRQRRAYSRLLPPPVTALPLEPLVVSPLGWLASSRQHPARGAHSHLPLVVPTAVVADVYYGPKVTLATLKRLQRRPATSRLFPPATLEPWSVALAERTIRTALSRIRPRKTTDRLAPPATLEPWSVALQLRTLSVHLATQLRLARRPGRARLAPPTVLQVFSGPATHLAALARFARARAAYPKLRAPAVVEPSLVPGDPRLVISTHLVRTRPRPTQAQVLPPATLVAAGEPTRDQVTLSAQLVRTRPRPTESRIWPRIVEPSLVPGDPRLTLSTTLVTSRPRPTTTTLAPPATLVAAGTPTLEQLTLLQAQVRTRPRPTASELKPPAATDPRLLGSDPRLVIRRVLVRTRPRPTTAHLGRPTVLETFQAAAVHLASRTRRELVRRAPHFKLSAPTVLEVFRGPLTVLVNRTKVERVRRAYRSVLRQPAVVLVPTADQLELRTKLVQRHHPARLASYSRLAPPAVLAESVLVTAIAGDAIVSDAGTFDAQVADDTTGDVVEATCEALVDDTTAFEAAVDDSSCEAHIRDDLNLGG